MQTDTVLPGTYFNPGSEGESPVETGKFTKAVPAGSLVSLDVWGLHMNRESTSSWTRSVRLTFTYIAALYWGEDAEAFKPERFIDTESYQWPRNACKPTIPCPSCLLDPRFRFPSLAVLGRCKVVHRSTICTCGSDRHPRERRASVPDPSSGRRCEKALRGTERNLIKMGDWDLVDTPERTRQIMSANLDRLNLRISASVFGPLKSLPHVDCFRLCSLRLGTY